MKAEKQQVRRHFARAADTYDRQAIIQRRVADRLLSLVNDHITHSPESILEIGCCTGILTGKVSLQFPQVHVLHVNDLVEDFRRKAGEIPLSGQVEFLAGDIETLPLPQQYQLIISSSTFHWLHDLASFFVKMHAHLHTGGLLAFAMYGPGNLQEIRALTGVGLDYPSLLELVTLLEKDFEVLTATELLETFHFAEPTAVLQHLRETGVNALAGPGWSRLQLQEFIWQYQDRFRSEKGVSLTYHPMYLMARSR